MKKSTKTISNLRSSLDSYKGERSKTQKLLENTKQEYKAERRQLRTYEQAREVVKYVGLKTQEQLQFHISDITTLAMEAVFPDPYTVGVEFVERRNKSECDIFFVKGTNRMEPKSSSGGGAIDVAAFALRIASYTMQRPMSRNVIILDEPFKHLNENLQDHASEMIKELSEKLGLQFIIVTHKQELTLKADKIFRVHQRKKISQVNEKV